jgi:hypothetical protein
VIRSLPENRNVPKLSAVESNEHLALKAKIEGWLEAEGIAFSNISDLNSFFHIQANLKNIPIHISESKVRKGVLAVQGSLELAVDQLEKYQSISADDKKTLFRSLFVMLDKSEYLFLLQENLAVQNWLKIQRPLYIEDLTRTMLLNEIKELNTKFVNINYLVNESLAEFKPVSEDSSMYK